MNGDSWHRAEELFQRAMQLPADERERFVESQCRADSELLTEVLSLLRAAEIESTFIERPATDAILSADADPGSDDGLVGGRIGPFEAVRLIGIGGMGKVYEGRRADGQFDQRVAIKVLRTDLGSGLVRRRFAQERRTLAKLEHPGIARLIDGGTLDDARPYLVMEFVEGERLDRYTEGARLEMREIVRLVLQVADAVQHAHQHLVIHRDLKPSNVLVDAQGRARVIDFGIALPLYLDSADTMMVSGQELLGTLAYMSPEQCVQGAGAEVDVRSDVYSLGVMLYQLLTGAVPHDVSTLSIFEAISTIKDKDPPKPSLHRAELAGDLETIVLKAIQRDRELRYASVGALADDLRRFLNHEPILARRQSRAYLASKFVRRHRVGVGLAAAAALGLAITTGLAVRAAVIASIQRVRADESAREAEALAYRSSIAAAEASLGMVHRPVEAGVFLQDAPEGLRGWEWRYLESGRDRTLWQHKDLDRASVVTFSPDGRTIAVGGTAGVGSIRFFDAVTGVALDYGDSDLGQRTQLPGNIKAVTFSPTLSLLASASSTGHIAVWNTSTGERVSEFMDDSEQAAQSLAFDPVRPWVVCMGADGSLVARDAHDLQTVRWGPLRELPGSERRSTDEWRIGEKQYPCVVRFAPDSSRFAVAWRQGDVSIHDSADGHTLVVGMRKEHTRPRDLRFDSTGTGLVVVGTAGVVERMDTTSLAVQDVVSTDGWVVHALSHDARYAAVRKPLENTVWLWDLEARTRWPLRGHRERAGIADLAFSSDGRRVAFAAWEHVAGVWDRSGLPQVRMSQPALSELMSVSFSNDSGVLAIGDRASRVRFFCAKSGLELGEFAACESGPINQLAFDPEDGTLYTASPGTIRRWDIDRGLLLSEFSPAEGSSSGFVRVPGSGVIAYCDGNEVVLRSVSDGSVSARLVAGDQTLGSVTVSADGQLIAAGEYSRENPTNTIGARIYVWDLQTGTLLHRLEGFEKSVAGLAFSPASDRLLAVGYRSRILEWSLGTEPKWDRIRIPDEWIVTSIAQSPDGQRIVTGGPDPSVGLWRWESTDRVLRLRRDLALSGIATALQTRGDMPTQYAVAFSPDGRMIGAACKDGRWIIWDDTPAPELVAAQSVRYAVEQAGGDWSLAEQILADDQWLTPDSRAEALTIARGLRRIAESPLCGDSGD
ncbi:MAG: protein kinase [Phycisphaerales bacterium]